MIAKTVVIASRHPVVSERFASALVPAEHRPVRVADVEDLLERVAQRNGRVDLLILDAGLGSIPGPDLVRKIRGLDEGRLPILVFSGTIESTDEVRRLATLGVAGYVNEHCTTPQILPALAPHLFPDSFNRRGSPRVALRIPVSFRLGESLMTATTLNLGEGGLAVSTMRPLELFSQARVTLRLPDSRQGIDAESRVMWTDHRVGMGLQFERIDAAAQAAIDDFVDRQADRARDQDRRDSATDLSERKSHS